MATDDVEGSRQAAALNHLLGEIGLTTDDVHAWWNFSAHEELGGRTATQAWLAGDTEAVRAVVDKWYEASKSAQLRAVRSPDAMAMLRQRLEDLNRRYGINPGQPRRTA